MAIRPDWMTGTLNLVAGTTDFTTTGSALQTAAIQAGDAIITATGYVLIIAEITGQNSGRLFDNCPAAAAGAGQPLRVRYQPDGSRVQAAVRMVRELLTTGNLEAFAALVGEADAVPVFVGQGVMKLVLKSEFGPDDTNGNLAALAALEDISNLSELATIAKANDQFIIMGGDGTIALKSIKSVIDVIEENARAIEDNATDIGKMYALPADGTADQILDATGAAIPKSGLPISEAAQKALGTKSSYNWIINPDFAINQRGGVKKPANGVYGFDRWKGHPNGIEQVIEDLPAGTYTLTWTGGGTGYFGAISGASPITVTVPHGNAYIAVPEAATKVSVVSGEVIVDPWPQCQRSMAQEIALCQRYYVRLSGNWTFNAGMRAVTESQISMPYPSLFRVSPTISFTVRYGVVHALQLQGGFISLYGNTNLDGWLGASNIRFDAEFN